jgi:hypothetical protein
VKIRRRRASGPVPDWQRAQEDRNREAAERTGRMLAEGRRQARAGRKTARKQRRAGRKARRARAAAPAPAPGSLRVPRTAALAAISVLVAGASFTSFAESYRGLYDWSREHGLSGFWSAVWPLQVDVFIAVGELALFVALADAWNNRSRTGAWLVTLAGLGVSVAGNVGHVHSHLLTDRATAAVPPLAAAAALAVGLGVLKRVVQAHGQRQAGDTGGEPGTVPGDADAYRSGNAAGNGQLAGTPQGLVPVPDGAPVPERPAVPVPERDGDAGPVRPRSANRSRSKNTNRSGGRATDRDAEQEFAAEITAGQVPSIYQIRTRLHVGNERAKVLRQYIARQALTT